MINAVNRINHDLTVGPHLEKCETLDVQDSLVCRITKCVRRVFAAIYDFLMRWLGFSSNQVEPVQMHRLVEPLAPLEMRPELPKSPEPQNEESSSFLKKTLLATGIAAVAAAVGSAVSRGQIALFGGDNAAPRSLFDICLPDEKAAAVLNVSSVTSGFCPSRALSDVCPLDCRRVTLLNVSSCMCPLASRVVQAVNLPSLIPISNLTCSLSERVTDLSFSNGTQIVTDIADYGSYLSLAASFTLFALACYLQYQEMQTRATEEADKQKIKDDVRMQPASTQAEDPAAVKQRIKDDLARLFGDAMQTGATEKAHIQEIKDDRQMQQARTLVTGYRAEIDKMVRLTDAL